MKHRLSYYFLLLALGVLVSGCVKLPFNRSVSVLKSRSSKPYIQADSTWLNDGSPEKKVRWIAFSDRDENSTQVSFSNDMPEKKLSFLEPLYVIKHKGSLVKVTHYDPSFNLKDTRGKISRKALKFTGWIAKEKLLLWSAAVKDKQTSLVAKAITAVAHADMMRHSELYFSGDSLLLFSEPGLVRTVNRKMAVGSLVYIYKRSEDKKSYLIGTSPTVTTDNAAQTIAGWISVHAIQLWGTKAAFTINTEASDSTTGLFANSTQAVNRDTAPLLPQTRLAERTAFENIFPIHVQTPGSNVLSTQYLENILDYSGNKVFNVLGKPVYYNRYREIVKNSRRLNIVFVVDGGVTNRVYLPSVKSVLQDLQLYFDSTTYFTSTKFGAVIYKHTPCNNDTTANVQPLTGNYTNIVKFIEEKQQLTNCGDASIYQPVNKGLVEAGNLLMPVKGETNIIIVVGTTGTDSDNQADAIAAITKVQARLMYFQSINKSADAYNDFILAAEKQVIASAQNISELKKEKLVDQNDVIPHINYSLQMGDSGIYYLDYPARSMTEGYVLYPKKGNVMLPGILKKNFDSLLHQVIADNTTLTASLHRYFKSNIGVHHTVIKNGFSQYIADAPAVMPDNFASTFLNIGNGFFIPAYIQRNPDSTAASPLQMGVLLTESEYDRQIYYFDQVFKQSGAANTRFKKRKAIKNYIHFLNGYAAAHQRHVRRRTIKHFTPAEALEFFTGYISNDSASTHLSLQEMKRSKTISGKMMLDFFNQFKYAANAMRDNKNNAAVRIDCKGAYYYWATQQLMPHEFGK